MPTASRHGRRFRLLIFFAVWAGLCIAGTGCASLPRYAPKAASPSDGATVRGVHKGGLFTWYKLTLEQVDGKEVDLPWWATDWQTPILVDPGERVLTVRCDFASDNKPNFVTAEIPVSLQAGHLYQLHGGADGNAVVFWVEDNASHSIAGRQVTINKPPAPSISETAASTAISVLLRVLVLIGTGG